MTLSQANNEVLAALRANTEGVAEDGIWWDVYLDNALSDLHLSAHQFAGHLSVLERAGLYRQLSTCFGQVRL